MRIFPDPLYYQEGQLLGVEQRTAGSHLNTKVSGKVNLIFYKLNLLPIFLVVVDKVKKKNRKIVILLSQRPVSRIANSASICKFKSNPSILNRVVPQVLFHNLTK